MQEEREEDRQLAGIGDVGSDRGGGQVHHRRGSALDAGAEQGAGQLGESAEIGPPALLAGAPGGAAPTEDLHLLAIGMRNDEEVVGAQAAVRELVAVELFEGAEHRQEERQQALGRRSGEQVEGGAGQVGGDQEGAAA